MTSYDNYIFNKWLKINQGVDRAREQVKSRGFKYCSRLHGEEAAVRFNMISEEEFDKLNKVSKVSGKKKKAKEPYKFYTHDTIF